MEVADHGGLSPEDKETILATWEEDAKHLAVAEGEGMTGGEPNRLSEVADAKRELAEQQHPGSLSPNPASDNRSSEHKTS
jgi:hypothetical protein